MAKAKKRNPQDETRSQSKRSNQARKREIAQLRAQVRAIKAVLVVVLKQAGLAAEIAKLRP